MVGLVPIYLIDDAYIILLKIEVCNSEVIFLKVLTIHFSSQYGAAVSHLYSTVSLYLFSSLELQARFVVRMAHIL